MAKVRRGRMVEICILDEDGVAVGIGGAGGEDLFRRKYVCEVWGLI